ncbi:transposase, partial [mine drainage metagenome]
VYSYLKIIQRCLPHLIREVDAFKSSENGKELSEEIHVIFKELKESLKSENMDERKSTKIAFEKRMEEIVKCHDPYGELRKPVEYTRNGLGSWFTCSFYPGMEPTKTWQNRQ